MSKMIPHAEHRRLTASCSKRGLYFYETGVGYFSFKPRGEKYGPILFEASSFEKAIAWADAQPIERPDAVGHQCRGTIC